MRWQHSERSRESYQATPATVQKAFDKQGRLWAANLHHPSLRAKKYGASVDLWQARVNRNWRFYFTIAGDTYCMEDVIAHPK